MLSPFLVSPPETIYPPSPCFYEDVPQPIHPLPPPHPCIPLHWVIELSQDQGSLLLMMSNKAILCYLCSWSHGYPLCTLWWWFSPWELWEVWLVDIVVLPLRLETPLDTISPLCHHVPMLPQFAVRGTNFFPLRKY